MSGVLMLTTHLHLVPRSRMSRSYTSPPCCLHGGSGTDLLCYNEHDPVPEACGCYGN
jgi:hypothetical protein